MTIYERFLSNVKIDPETECWEWQRFIKANGYGVVKVRSPRRQLYTHRFSWECRYGAIPDGMFVCHKCDNRKCVNPSHLFLGTPKDNLDDASQKGRMEHGSGRYNAKLNEANVAEIRNANRAGETQKSLALRFGVTQSVIQKIVSRQKWRHVA